MQQQNSAERSVKLRVSWREALYLCKLEEKFSWSLKDQTDEIPNSKQANIAVII
jgi:hypothetical protein